MCVAGDLGQTYNSLSTLQHYMVSGAQAVLFLGDLSYADRYKYNDVGLRWDTWGRFIEQSAAIQPWIWCAGNHEIEYMPYLVKYLHTCFLNVPFLYLAFQFGMTSTFNY